MKFRSAHMHSLFKNDVNGGQAELAAAALWLPLNPEMLPIKPSNLHQVSRAARLNTVDFLNTADFLTY
jgi:hypothetical protein